jgi:hypothetical protein
MSARCVVSPVYALDCDSCGAVFEPQGRFNRAHETPARGEAQEAGWSVRPPYGRGSRSAPDLCPACAPAEPSPEVQR